FGGNVVYPHIQASMKKKKDWPKVVMLAKLTITSMYLLIGIPAYLTYGRSTKSPIYLSLPSGFIVDITMIMITMHVLSALPVYQTAFSLELENYLFANISRESSKIILRTILRLTIVFFTVYIAITVPYFTNIMSLLGAMGNGVLLMILPMLVWIKLFGWNNISSLEKVWAIFILFFALFGAIVGTWDALSALSAEMIESTTASNSSYKSSKISPGSHFTNGSLPSLRLPSYSSGFQDTNNAPRINEGGSFENLILKEPYVT
ncbi:7877_t:CDS:2, partial [Cetraspora pellucida]